MIVAVSIDGGNTFAEVTTFTANNSDGAFHDFAFDLSPLDGATSLVLRFDANMNSTGDQLFVDDVVVSGNR